jgi:hypothetical protein
MPKDFLDDIFDGIEAGAAFGINEASDAISDKAATLDDPVQAFVLDAAAALLSKHGIEGISLARTQFEALLAGDELDPVELRKLPLYQRAPLLAAATEREISARKTGDAALAAVGNVLGKLIKGLASGAFKVA